MKSSSVLTIIDVPGMASSGDLAGKRSCPSPARKKLLGVFFQEKNTVIARVCPASFSTARQLAEELPENIAGIAFVHTQAFDLPDLMDALKPWLGQRPADLIFSLELHPGSQNLPQTLEPALAPLFGKGLRMICWHLSDASQPLPRALLYQASKQGIWNHVTGEGLFDGDDNGDQAAWIANTPNIVHSFENTGGNTPGTPPSVQAPMDPNAQSHAVKIPDALLEYGNLPPLPGVPFWQVLAEPGFILAGLTQYTNKELVHLRADLKKEKVLTLGSGLEYYFKKPAQISKETMDEIVAMVDAGGAVDITLVRSNLERAYLIAFACENGVIVGNSSLKHPRKAFVDRLGKSSGLDFSNFVERGYTSVRPEYRSMGIGARLLEGLTSRARDVKIFSIISEDNLATKKIATRNNTRKIATYFSEKLGKHMEIWMPEHMIDSTWDLES